MGDVTKRGRDFGICLAPSESDVETGVAKLFGERVVEPAVVANYTQRMGGTLPLNVWTDRVPGPPLPPNPAFFVPPIVLSMFAWLSARHPQLAAQAGAFAQFFSNVGFKSAVPDIIDSRSPRCWYEIKPGSPTGLRAGIEKLRNIPDWIDQRFGLGYQPGAAYNPGPNDDVDLLERLPPQFRGFIQMLASSLGGIVRIEVKLTFRRLSVVPGLGSVGALILYWICISIRFGDEALAVDEVEDCVRNIARWIVIHVFRAVNGTFDPAKPLQLTVDCKDATIQSNFVPGDLGLLISVLRSPPASGYTVVGGSLVGDMLRRMDETAALVARLFLPPPPQPLLSRREMALIATGALVILAVGITVLAIASRAPPAVAGAEATVDAAGATFAIAEEELARQAARIAAQEALERAALQRMLGEEALRRAFSQAGQVIAREGTRRAVAAASTMFIVGAASTAQAAQSGPPSSGAAGVPRPQLVGTIQSVQLLPWWDLSVIAQMGNVTASKPPAPRQQVPLPDGSVGIFLYTIALTDFPERRAVLTPAVPP
jgi:hypothetical protein